MKVLTLEQMNRLKELGVDVKPKGECLIYQIVMGIDIITLTDKFSNDDIKAFSLQDIIELLPPQLMHEEETIYFNFENIGKEYGFYYVTCDFEVRIYFNDRDILQAAYNMLLWVIENGYLKTK